MKYKRPDPVASTESWVSIWLGCMDARFTTTRPQAAETLKVSTRCKGYQGSSTPQKMRLGTSLHQSHAGEGYDPYEAYHLHPNVMPTYFSRDNAVGSTLLGATPREIRTALQRRLRKEN